MNYTESQNKVQDAIRERFKKLTPTERGAAIRAAYEAGGSAPTHVWRFLRGDTGKVGPASMDLLLEHAGLEIRVTCRVVAKK